MAEEDPIGYLQGIIEDFKTGADIKNQLISELERENKILKETIAVLERNVADLRKGVELRGEIKSFSGGNEEPGKNPFIV